MIQKYYCVLGVYDQFSVVWSLCEDLMDYHNAYLAAGQVALENSQRGFYVSNFESSKTSLDIIILHWEAITPLDSMLLANSFDEYLEKLNSLEIVLEFDETAN